MTAPDMTPDERATWDRFEAAPDVWPGHAAMFAAGEVTTCRDCEHTRWRGAFEAAVGGS